MATTKTKRLRWTNLTNVQIRFFFDWEQNYIKSSSKLDNRYSMYMKGCAQTNEGRGTIRKLIFEGRGCYHNGWTMLMLSLHLKLKNIQCRRQSCSRAGPIHGAIRSTFSLVTAIRLSWMLRNCWTIKPSEVHWTPSAGYLKRKAIRTAIGATHTHTHI